MLREGQLGREHLWCLLYKQMGELLNYIMLSARCYCEFASLETHYFSSVLLPPPFCVLSSMDIFALHERMHIWVYLHMSSNGEINQKMGLKCSRLFSSD